MATGFNFNEEEAYIKIVLCVIKCGTRVLRNALIHHVADHQQTLDEYLSARKPYVLSGKNGKQYDPVFFPENSNTTDITKWDISILIHVFVSTKHVCKPILFPMNHLHVLRTIRNEVVHNRNTKLDERTFDDYWKKLSNVFIDMLHFTKNTQLKREIMNELCEIEEGKFANEYDACKTILQEWYRTNSSVEEKLNEIKEG